MSHRRRLGRPRARATARLCLALALMTLLPPAPASHARAAGEAGSANSARPGAPARRGSAAERANLEKLPLAFAPNVGQMDASVKYHARLSGAAVFFKAGEVFFSLPLADSPAGRAGHEVEDAARGARQVSLRQLFVGARPGAQVVGRERLAGTLNYFVGRDASRWRASLPTYGRLAYRQLYAGIDLQYDGVGGALKSTYSVAAGADPARIRWRYDGASGVRVDASSGDLRVGLRAGGEGAEVVERAPLAWQQLGARRAFVPVRYDVAADGSVGFRVGAYDRARPLVIDPTLAFSRYVGGQGQDFAQGIALDSDKNIYITGVTSSPNFPQALVPVGAQPVAGGQSDAFVIKLDPTATTVLYSTYLGGSEADWGLQIALDAARNAHVVGYTRSPDFPTSGALQASYAGGHTDAFAAKLSADGRTLLYSTYLGGGAEEVAYGVAVGADGQAAVAGYTRSTNFPTAGPAQAANAGLEDAFVLKLSAGGGALTYSTYVGGSGSDFAQGLAADPAGNLYVAGHTTSDDLPVAHALQPARAGHEDAFVLKLRPDGTAPAYLTYLGGADGDFARAIAADVWGRVYLTGSTRSADFPTTAAAFQTTNGGGDDAFVAKLDADGGRLGYSTYLGGAGDDYGAAVTVDRGSYASVTGRTRSANFPVANPVQPAISPEDGRDAFVARLTPTGGALDFATFLGGNDHEIGEGLAADAAGNLYVTGYTFSTDFHGATPEPFRGLLDEDVFVVKFDAPTPPPAPCAPAANVALAGAGAAASASSVQSGRDYSPAGAIDGDRKGANWERGGGWNDATRDLWPDWLEVDFDGLKRINQVIVYTLQDNFHRPQEPTPLMTTSYYGLLDFEVQYWDGAGWATLGSVNGSRLVMNKFVFPEVVTPKIRVFVTNARAHYSRVVEVEAFGCAAP